MNPKPTSINDFSPPRTGLPLLIIGAVLGVVVLIIVFFFAQPPTIKPHPLATPTPSASQAPTNWGMPFLTGNESCEGMWDITSHLWGNGGLEIQVRVFSKNCSLELSFGAFSNTDAAFYDPEPSPGFMDFYGLSLEPGQERNGSIFFYMPRTSCVIMMSDEYGSQLSALDVAG